MNKFFFILCLFCVGGPLSAQQILYENGAFRLDREPSIVAAPGAAKKPYWRYCWDFGDGTYCMSDKDSRMEKVSHTYAADGNYTVRVFLTPYYSLTTQKTAIPPRVISAKGSGRPAQSCRSDLTGGCSGNEMVDIASDADGELVPGSEVQFMIHYKAPMDLSGGRIVLAFNGKGSAEKLSADALSAPLAADIVARNSGIRVQGASDLSASNVLGNELKGFQTLVLLTDRMKAGEERCVRLTFKTRGGKPFKLANLGKRTSLRVHWIPNEKKGGKGYYSSKYWLKISDYHDPNKMTVRPRRAYYKRNVPSRMQYSVHFQNDGPGEVRDIEIMVPWHKTLDAGSIVVQEVHPACPVCPPGFDPLRDTLAGCYEKDISRAATEGKVFFRFHNVVRYGSKQDGVANRNSKGHVSFTVNSNNRRDDITRERASIVFAGKTPVITRPVKTRWRYNTAGLRVGYHLRQQLSGYEYQPQSAFDRLSVGAWWQNVPLKSGFGHSYEVQYAGLSHVGYDARYIAVSNLLGHGGGMVYRETIRQRYLQIGASGHVQWKGLAGFRLGGGIALPAQFDVSAETRLYSEDGIRDGLDISPSLEFSIFPILQNSYTLPQLYDLLSGVPAEVTSTGEARLGLFSSKQDLTLLGVKQESRKTVGYYLSAGVELGLLGDISVDIRQDISFFPRFYRQNCMTLFSTNIGLKAKLITFKRR